MLSLFSDTISKAISDYRRLLRRFLPQAERMAKLMELNLKELDYDEEIALYHMAQRIIQDIETHMDSGEKNYYTYSGVGNFGHFLKSFISDYMIEHGHVIHRAQKASRALLDTIQIVSSSSVELNQGTLDSVNRNSDIIAHYGTEDQCDLHKENLERYYRERGAFFGPLLHYFNEQLNETQSVSEAA